MFRSWIRRLFLRRSPPPFERRTQFRPQLESLDGLIVPTATLTIASLGDITEGGISSAFRLTRTDTSGSLMVNVTYSGTASSGDYTNTLIVMFMNGQATTDITITPFNDSTSEPTETLVCTINSSMLYTVGTPGSATMNIFDNDAPVVTVTKVADASETGTSGIFRFTRTGNLNQVLTVGYGVGGTATSGSDYIALSGVVNFGVGQVSVDVAVVAVDDTVNDPNETVSVAIIAADGFTVGVPGEASLTITDNPFLVNTLADTGDANLGDMTPADINGNVSLRAAIEQANFNAAVPWGSSSFTIRFADSLFPGGGGTTTITLSNGKLPSISADLSIIGRGQTELHIAGTGESGMLQFTADSTSSVQQLTLKEGRNTAGGIGTGGAIENAGYLTLTSVTIANCTANDGGAIFSTGGLTITTCQITGNTSVGGGGANGWGGGISVINNTSVTTIQGSVISGNSAAARGGGIAIRANAQITLTNTEVSSNSATSSGGGVYNSGGTFSMTGGSIKTNIAASGAGLNHSGGTSTVQDVAIQGNTSNLVGGGIFIGDGTFTMTGGSINNNSAPNGAGIRQQAATATFQGVTISNNQASEWGGGVHIIGGSLTFTDCTFAGNQATLGGAKIAKKGTPMITLGPGNVGIVAGDIEIDPR